MAEYVRVYKQVDGIWTWVTELESGAGGDVTAADIDSTPATDGQVLTADGAGGADWENGGSQTARALYGGDPVTITDGGEGILTWDTKFSGDDLLDLSDPENPTVVSAGVYGIAVQIGGVVLTDGGTFYGLVDLDLDGDDAQLTATSPPSVATTNNPSLLLSGTYYLPADAVLNVSVTNQDGTASRDFSLSQVVLQRIS